MLFIVSFRSEASVPDLRQHQVSEKGSGEASADTESSFRALSGQRAARAAAGGRDTQTGLFVSSPKAMRPTARAAPRLPNSRLNSTPHLTFVVARGNCSKMIALGVVCVRIHQAFCFVEECEMNEDFPDILS